MLLSIIIILVIIVLSTELNHHFRITSPLIIKPKEFKRKNLDAKQLYSAWIEISNIHSSMEVMIPFFKVNPQVIGISKVDLISIKTTIKPIHPDEEEQRDDYWISYILKSKKSTLVKIDVEYEIKSSVKDNFKCIWLEIEWGNYGPFGFINRFDGFVIPNYSKTTEKNSSNNNIVEPIKTHILGSFDDPISVLKSYLPKDCLPSDILTIGESPLAIMQGNYINYKNINVSLIAMLLCKGFHPTSSLATACGMQTLINIYGPTRVIVSWIIGGIFKSLGIKGVFYRLAGEQARLIDDITGTTPPYDKSIVLGPKEAQLFCIEASRELKVNVAVVDVNDLGRVKIISTNDLINTSVIKRALISNPAGNANQQTPLVLIRQLESKRKSHDS